MRADVGERDGARGAVAHQPVDDHDQVPEGKETGQLVQEIEGVNDRQAVPGDCPSYFASVHFDPAAGPSRPTSSRRTNVDRWGSRSDPMLPLFRN
jgi:hypothetical protein